MSVFIALVLKMMPLYAVMAVGYVFGRKVKDMGSPISLLQINVIAPIVIATGIAPLKMQGEYLLLPAVFFALCSLIALSLFALGKTVWRDNTRNLLAFAGGLANTGYFGVPLALILFPPDLVALFLLAMTGFLVFESTLGYYLVARGRHTVKDSFARLLRLPMLYGCIIGIILSMAGIALPEMAQAVIRDFRGAYVVLGALMIGLGLSQAGFAHFDLKFFGMLTVSKFIVWPLCVLGLVALDRNFLGIFSADVYPPMFLLAIVPLPVNAVAFGLLLKLHPEKAATAVFISTVMALFYIPAVLAMTGYL